jgi:hypothetical protein
MNKHPYIRAYLAGIAVPTVVLLGMMIAFIFLRYVYDVSTPIERVIVFPMAAVPNIWGLWNVLYVARLAGRNVSLGLYGGLMPLGLVPLGYGVTRLLDFAIPSIVFSAFPFVFPAVLIIYYLAWKYLVGFLNRELGIA